MSSHPTRTRDVEADVIVEKEEKVKSEGKQRAREAQILVTGVRNS